MHASVDVTLEITIQERKLLTLSTVGRVVPGFEIEAHIVEAIVEMVDAQLTESYCDEKYEHGNREKRYRRAGKTTRTAPTSAGEHEFTLHQVKDTNEKSHFRPVECSIGFNGLEHYQEDVELYGLHLRIASSLFPFSHLHRKVFPTELLEGEFAQVPDTFHVDVIDPLNNRLVMGAFAIDLVRLEPGHCLNVT